MYSFLSNDRSTLGSDYIELLNDTRSVRRFGLCVIRILCKLRTNKGKVSTPATPCLPNNRWTRVCRSSTISFLRRTSVTWVGESVTSRTLSTQRGSIQVEKLIDCFLLYFLLKVVVVFQYHYNCVRDYWTLLTTLWSLVKLLLGPCICSFGLDISLTDVSGSPEGDTSKRTSNENRLSVNEENEKYLHKPLEL